MSEFRQDPVTREWVIVVPERAARPHARGGAAVCPFCPGAEEQTPGVVSRLDDEQGRWLVRVIENRYPILRPTVTEPETQRDGPWHRLPGCGRHEIVIDAREHDRMLGRFAPEQIARLLRVYAARVRELGRVPGIREVVVFRNHGEQAGATLRHPHSQIVATPVISPVTRRRIMDEIAYFDDHGACPLCRTLEAERESEVRFLYQSGHFASFVPFASRVSHHLRIVPLRHCPRFDDAADAELDDLAGHLGTVMAALETELDDPDHNLVIASPPLDQIHQGANHWYIDVLPRLAIPAGFEIGSGLIVTTSAPEKAAAALRGRLKPNGRAH